MYSVKHEPDASKELVACSQRLATLATGLIEEGQRRDEVRPGPVEDITLPVMAAIHGWSCLWSGA